MQDLIKNRSQGIADVFISINEDNGGDLKIENIDRTESYDFPSHMLMKIKISSLDRLPMLSLTPD